MLYIFLRYVKSDRVVILINICIALTVSYIIFLAGVNQTQNKVRVYLLLLKYNKVSGYSYSTNNTFYMKLLFCKPRVEVTPCFFYKVMGPTFYDRINTQLIY